MASSEQKESVDMWRALTMNKQSGYTLLSTMLALVLLYMIAALVAMFTSIIFHEDSSERWGNKDIWIFMNQFQKELESAQNVQCQPNDISFQKDENLVDYRQSGERILRTLNHNGYEIVLNNITKWACVSQASLVNVKVEDKKGTIYRWSAEIMVK